MGRAFVAGIPSRTLPHYPTQPVSFFFEVTKFIDTESLLGWLFFIMVRDGYAISTPTRRPPTAGRWAVPVLPVFPAEPEATRGRQKDHAGSHVFTALFQTESRLE